MKGCKTPLMKIGPAWKEKKAAKEADAKTGYEALESHMSSALDASPDVKSNSVRKENSNNFSSRYVAKKAGAEALGGDLKPQVFHEKHKVSEDEKSGRDVLISRKSGKGYIKKSKVVNGEVVDKHKELSKGRVKRISNRIDKQIAKQNKRPKKKGSPIKQVRNPREWTPPGQETTPEQKKQLSMPNKDVKHGLDKGKLEKDWKEMKFKEHYRKHYVPLQSHAIQHTAAPHEYLLGGGAAKGGFTLAKTGIGIIKEVAKKQIPKIMGNVAGDVATDKVTSSIIKNK